MRFKLNLKKESFMATFMMNSVITSCSESLTIDVVRATEKDSYLSTHNSLRGEHYRRCASANKIRFFLVPSTPMRSYLRVQITQQKRIIAELS